MCAPSAEDPLEPCPPLPTACVAAACAIKFFPFSTFSMKFFPIARTDGFRLCRGDGLSTARDTPVMEDMLALDDWSTRWVQIQTFLLLKLMGLEPELNVL